MSRFPLQSDAQWSLIAVQRMLGHASAAVTLDTYADLFDDDLDAVATRLNRARMSSVSRASFQLDPGEQDEGP